MQKILQTDETINNEALRKGKRKRTETMDSENANSDVEKGQRDSYSGNAFLPGESSSEDEMPLAELSREELCAKIKTLKEKLTNTRKENSRLRQSLVMLQESVQVLPERSEEGPSGMCHPDSPGRHLPSSNGCRVKLTCIKAECFWRLLP